MLPRLACLLSIVFLAFSLSGCFLKGYRYDVQQGNELSPAQVHSIKNGMTDKQVIKRLGMPILHKIYLNNELNYVYTLEHGSNKLIVKYLVITFRNKRVVHIRTNLSYDQAMHLPKPIKES